MEGFHGVTKIWKAPTGRVFVTHIPEGKPEYEYLEENGYLSNRPKLTKRVERWLMQE